MPRQYKPGIKRQLTTQREILAKPTIGEAKKGDLSGVSVYKFKINKQEILLAYSVGSKELLLIALGAHENFYRDMKR